MKALQRGVWSGRSSAHSDHWSVGASEAPTATADRTISFRQVATQRQLDGRSGQPCRTKDRRRSCRTRGERPRLSADTAPTRYCRFCPGAFYKVSEIFGRRPSTCSLLQAVYHRLPSTVYRRRLPGRLVGQGPSFANFLSKFGWARLSAEILRKLGGPARKNERGVLSRKFCVSPAVCGSRIHGSIATDR